MAALPVIKATTYFIIAISRLPARAKTMALFDPCVLIQVGVMLIMEVGFKNPAYVNTNLHDLKLIHKRPVKFPC
jgi:hypothetical protein